MNIRHIIASTLFLLALSISHPTLAATNVKAIPLPSISKAQATSSLVTRAQTEERVREYFKDVPNMIEIARCESDFRQFTDAGNVLRGGMSGQMVGVYQFYESIHAAAAKSLGFDLSTLEGNLAYARHVYETEGTTPWVSCLHAPIIATPTVAHISAPKSDIAKLQEQIKMLTQLIVLLQKQLALMNATKH